MLATVTISADRNSRSLQNQRRLFMAMAAAQAKHWVIGDVHGCHEALVSLLTVLPHNDHLVFCGDVINRGPAIADCMNQVWDLVCAGRATWLRGNHEQALLQGLEQSPASGHDDLLTIDTYRQLGDALSRQWLQRLRQLPEVFQGEGWLATHAGFDNSGRPDLHIREPFWDHYDGRYGRVVVGHTPRPTVECQNHIVMIDTGAVYGGLLSAFCPETDAVVQVQGPRAVSTTETHPRELATGLPC